MSYSRRQLYAMGEPLGDGATRRAVGGKIIYGGGGDITPEKQTTVVDIPDWAKPYAKESLGKASALTSTPYQAYGGERIAQFSPLQKQAFQQAGQQQVAGQVGLGSGLATLSGISSFQDPGTAQGFMSPYMQAVVDQQMESAQRQADIAATQRGAQAVRAGAFGGSRQAIENAEAARALASQKGQIQAQGLQSAFERGQAQFNAEQANRLAAAQALGQLGQQQFGQQMDITGQQAQFGQQQRQATQDILSQQYQDFLNQQRAPYDQLSFMSSLIRGTPMGQTTTMYTPPASTTSQLIGLGTAAAGAYGAYAGKAAGGEVKGYAAGGIASLNQPELAAMAGGMSDEQLGRTAQMPSITELAKMTLAAEAQQRARMRQQAMAQQAMMQQPQGTVAEEQMAAIEQGIGGLDVPDDLVGEESMAGGGIVAFQSGGSTWWEEELERLQEPPQESSALGRGITRALTKSDDVDALIASAKRKQAEGIPLTAAEKAVFAQVKPAASGIAAVADGSDNRFARKPVAMGITDQPPAGKKQPAVADRGTSTASAPGAAATGIAAALPQSLQALQAKYRSEVEAAGKAGEQIEADRLAALKRDQEEMGLIGAEREKRLKAQEESLKGAEDKNLNMALIEAGLAIMAGNSANAFENIGKGAMVGTKAYTTGMNRIQDRKDKLDEAVMALDELRYGEKKASKKELRDGEAAVNKAKQQTAAALAAVTGEDMKMAVDLYTKQLDRQATLAAASIRSTASEGLTAAKRAELADKAADNVRAKLKETPGAQYRTTEAEFNRLVDLELNRLLAAAGGASATSAPDLTGWGKAQAVN